MENYSANTYGQNILNNENNKTKIFASFRNKSPPTFLVTGLPGTGKIFCVKKIEAIRKIIGIKNVKKINFMRVSAIIISGSTIRTFFGIGIGTTDKNVISDF